MKKRTIAKLLKKMIKVFEYGSIILVLLSDHVEIYSRKTYI